MLKKLLKFFFEDDNLRAISYYRLYSLLLQWAKDRRKPYSYELPNGISFPEDFWKNIVNLYHLTDTNGNERAVSVFWADGDLIFSTITEGNEKMVKSNSQVKITYTPKPNNNQYYTKEVFVDGKRYLTKEIYYKNLPQKIDITYLFNIHTHPAHSLNGQKQYGIFSAQDIKSFVNSNALITGLIRDDFTLLFKTTKSIAMAEHLKDQDITEQTLTNKYGFVLYNGRFNQKLFKILSELEQRESATNKEKE
ncbi:MAG TPA: hypothetical protein VHA74_03820 [Candidatus Dojkabacteria bacterium]|nr:hypothetical protein [Candidatus Dojkabacteria bacterium]